MMFLVSLAMAAARCQDTQLAKVEFTTFTRGYQKQLFISPDSLVQIIDGRQSENGIIKRKLAPGEWDTLTLAVRDLEMKEVSTLQAPSNRRTFDAARHSVIRIELANGQTVEHNFDDEHPHPRLKPLMDEIIRMSDSHQR